MLSIFKRKTHNELEAIINKLEANRANNYKDNAQSNLKELELRFSELSSQNALSAKQTTHYAALIDHYKNALKEFSHKDQKPYWT